MHFLPNLVQSCNIAGRLSGIGVASPHATLASRTSVMRITSEGLTCSQLVDCLHVRLSGRELIMKNVRTPWMVALAAGTIFAGSALAQPAVFDDLGDIDPAAGTTVTRSGLSTTATGDTAVVWFKFTLTAPTTYANLGFLNAWNVGTGDTAITLFNNSGTIVAEDDDDGPGVQSAISFGTGDAQFPNGGTGTPVINNGRDLDLPAGIYWIGIAHYLNDPTAGWTYEATTQTLTGPWNLNVGAGIATLSAPTVTFTDIGTLGPANTITRTGETLGAAEVKWFKVVVPDAIRTDGTFLDIDTEGSLLSTANTTRLSIYNKLGAFMGFTDTTDGSNSLSQLTFGDDAPARPAFGNGLAYNGRDAAIFRGGEYYIAVAGPGVAPSTTATSGQLWGHTSTSTTSGTINLRLTNVPFPTPAGGTGTAVTIVEGQSGLLRVTTTPGANPVSSATSVVVDTSLIGGTAGVVLVDDGTNGDVNAGDGIFSRAITVNVAQQAVQQLPFVVTDSVGRTSTGSIAATISASFSGACCNGTSCSITRQFLCTSGGGSFAGAGTDCGGTLTYIVASSPNAFAPIAATGTPLSFTTTFGGVTATFDDGITAVPLPFPVNIYGSAYTEARVVTNGFMQFGTGTSTTFTNAAIPSTATPNNALYPLWDDFALQNGTSGNVYTLEQGIAPNRTFTISWENAGQYTFATVITPVGSNNFQVVFTEGSDVIEYRYGAVDAITAPQSVATDTVTVGAENAAGTQATVIDTATVGTGNVAFTLTYGTTTDPCVATGCDDIDFNNNDVFPEDADVIDFFNVLAGAECPACNDIDFNNNGVFPEDADVIDFFNVLAGGECP